MGGQYIYITHKAKDSKVVALQSTNDRVARLSDARFAGFIKKDYYRVEIVGIISAPGDRQVATIHKALLTSVTSAEAN